MVDLNLWREENLVPDSGTLSTFHKLNYKFTETRITQNCNFDNFFLNCKNDKYHSYGSNLNIFTANPFREAYWIVTIYMTCCALRYAGAVAAAYWRTKQAYELYLENMEQDKKWEEELNNIEQDIQKLSQLTYRHSNKGPSRQSSTPIDPTDNQAHCLSQISEKEAEKYRPKPLERIKSNLTNFKQKLHHKMSQITDTTTNLKNVSFSGNMTENLSAIKEFGAGLGDDLVKTGENSFKFGWGFARSLLVYSAGFLVYQMIPFAGGKKRSLANAALFTLQFTIIFGILMNSAYSHDGIMHELLEISVSKYRDMAKHAGGSVFTAVTLNNTFTNNVVDQMNTFVTDQTDKIPWTSPVGIIPGICILTAWFLFIVTIMWYNDEHCSQFLENEVDYLSRNPRGAPDYFNDTEYYQQNELKEEMYQKMRLKRQQTQYVKKLDLFDPLAKREKKDADNALQRKRNERKKRIQENQRKLSRRSRASTNTSNSESWIAGKNEENIPIIEKSEISDPIVLNNQETTPEDQLSFLKNERQKLKERYRNSRRRIQEFNNNLGGSIKPRVSRKDFLRRELREGNAQIASKRVTQSLKNPAVNY